MKIFVQNDQLNPDVMDALYELSNVGVGKATNALGKMINERITIRTPKLQASKLGVKELVANYADKLSLGILMSLGEKLGGAVLIIIEHSFVSELVERLTGVRYSDEELLENEDSLSAVQEVANIMAASYMTAIGAYTGLRIYLTPVMVGMDIISALIAYPVERMHLDANRGICIDTTFVVVEAERDVQSCEGNIIVFPDEESLDTIMTALMG